MRAFSPITLAALILAGMVPLSLLQADYLKNTDFKEASQCWRGDGQAAFLRPDGTEGAEGDKGAIPVLKITLTKAQMHAVSQDYQTHDNPRTQHIRVDVYASVDFKRSKFASDYSPDLNWKMGRNHYGSDDTVPNVDFWIRDFPGDIFKIANLKPGEWVTVDCLWDDPPPADDRTVCFVVPPGEGTIYLKNPSVTP